jgi:mannose/fructose-specific phosphotransferase system component IIA
MLKIHGIKTALQHVKFGEQKSRDDRILEKSHARSIYAACIDKTTMLTDIYGSCINLMHFMSFFFK